MRFDPLLRTNSVGEVAELEDSCYCSFTPRVDELFSVDGFQVRKILRAPLWASDNVRVADDVV